MNTQPKKLSIGKEIRLHLSLGIFFITVNAQLAVFMYDTAYQFSWIIYFFYLEEYP